MNKEVTMFGKFLATEIHRIDVDKWLEGEKIKKDPGNDFCMHWIKSNAKWFRNAWDSSVCKDCLNWEKCGHEVRRDCKNFTNEDNLS